MRIPEAEQKGTEGVFKAIMAENFPNQGRELGIQILKPKVSQID